MIEEYYAKAKFEFGFNSLCKMTLPENLDGQTVLDVGCRRGKGVYKLSQHVGEEGHAIGVDWVPAFIDDARMHASSALEKSGLSRNNMEFHVGFPEDLKACGIGDGDIDVVWVNSVHNLFYDQSRAFSEIARVLKPGGILLCETVYADSSRDMKVLDEARALGNAIQAAQPKEMFESLLGNAGIGCIEYSEQHEVSPSMGFKEGFEVSAVPSEEDVRFIAAVVCAKIC